MVKGALASDIEVLEEMLNRLAFVLGTVSTLSDFLVDHIINILNLTWLVSLIVKRRRSLLGESPGF